MGGAAPMPSDVQPVALQGVRRRLVNEFQRDFPLSSRPFRDIGRRIGWEETEVLAALTELRSAGVVSRVGPVIRPNTIGVSALAAMAVPPPRLEAVAAVVNGRPEVNHNYEREHRFNLWFVLAAGNAGALDRVVAEIQAETGLAVMVLPMLDDYYIDLGFDLDGRRAPRPANAPAAGTVAVEDVDRNLLRIVQDGLPLVPRPYASVAGMAGLTEDQVCARFAAMIEAGVIKRLGVIVRHHECGYRHNAMVVWDVPDEQVHEAGRRLAAMDAVRLCYRRPRRLPDWPYNLFCMIHGRDRDTVRRQLDRVSAAAGLQGRPCDVLFSVRRFKQRGARYDPAPADDRREEAPA